MIVREFTEQDLLRNETMWQLCEIARTFIEESDYGWIYSPEVSDDTWRKYVAHPDMAVLLAERNDVIAGGVVVAHDRDFTLNRVGYVVKFYILPAYRRTRAPLLVAKAMTDWFDAQQCWASFATATAAIGADEAFVKLLTRYGYAPCGPTLMRQIHG
ncbi:MAG: hypothetical protein QNJ92_17350 [Alphaproteobacteria bacterium]|nr:hypothetical protein [Alphaproteobacteria bacterium]